MQEDVTVRKEVKEEDSGRRDRKWKLKHKQF
jgi:hypothetical protein